MIPLADIHRVSLADMLIEARCVAAFVRDAMSQPGSRLELSEAGIDGLLHVLDYADGLVEHVANELVCPAYPDVN